jgi:hypothetical protein
MFKAMMVHPVQVVKQGFGEGIDLHEPFQEFPWVLESVFPHVHLSRHEVHHN